MKYGGGKKMGIDIINGNRPPELNSFIFTKKRLPSDGAMQRSH